MNHLLKRAEEEAELQELCTCTLPSAAYSVDFERNNKFLH